MCVGVRNIILRLAPASDGLYLHLRVGFDRLIRLSRSLNSQSFAGTCRVRTYYHASSQQTLGARRDDSRSLSKKATTMKTRLSLAVGATGILAIVGLLGWTASAQAPAPAAATLACDDDPAPDTTPIDGTLLTKGLPCAEKVSPVGPSSDGLVNLQHGFDFYSWLTFLALNAPADGSPIDKAKPNTPTKWEQRSNFKQLLDVMLEDGRVIRMEGCEDYPAGMRRAIQKVKRPSDGHRNDRGKLQ